MSFFDVNHVVFEIIGYSISYVELIGTFFGLISVYLASKGHILTWPTGIVNELFLFLLFFQIQLYADMFLQVYFFVVTIYGWYNWRRKSVQESVSTLKVKAKFLVVITIILGGIFIGKFFSNIHLFLPQYFSVQASYPYTDSLVMILSVVATILLAQKKIETWYLWILVDVICVFLFFKKGVFFLAIEYLIFLALATYGLLNWKRNKYG